MNPRFFVIGLPRSGTTWLSRFVANENPDIHVCHEPYKKSDFAMDTRAAFLPWEADRYVDEVRSVLMAERYLFQTRAKPFDGGYGEVTPRLRYFAAAVQRKWPDARFIHLVRDPRAAVLSLMNYGYYSSTGRVHRTPAPDNGDWSQVKRASWAWSFGNNRIRQTIPIFYRLEDLISKWEIVERFANFLGIEIRREYWEVKRNQPANLSKRTNPEYGDWPPEWRKELHEMTDEEARQYGYC